MTAAHRIPSELNGVRILVVEDEPLLAFDYQDELEAHGAVPTVAFTLADGLSAIAASGPEFAIIDLNLGSELSWPIAVALTRRGTPFVFVSGRCGIDNRPKGLNPLACMEKPIGARVVIDRICRLVAGRLH